MVDKDILLVDYYEDWMNLYKKGFVRPVTFRKYENDLKRLREIAPTVKVADLDKATYQRIINKYAEDHEKQTVKDWHTHLKAVIDDAMDEGLLKSDPTKRVAIKGKDPAPKKPKFLSLEELQAVLNTLKLGKYVNYDWLIYFIAKTGTRFAEALAVTPNDFDFEENSVNITKTWNYKYADGFAPTKNPSSVRKIYLDKETAKKFKKLIKNLDKDKPFFLFTEDNKVYNSTVNDILTRHCREAGVTPITIHGLRHTHASILLYYGVSVLSVSRRLGHSNITTTQKVYLHIIQELENKDRKLILDSLANF